MSDKRWALTLLGLAMVTLVLITGFMVVVDPYFHYHAPLEQLSYPLNNQRYQNDGIVRNFEYDAIIAGTSMTENFKASECDALFGVKSVKVPLEGASYKEINDNLIRALGENQDVKMIIRGLDTSLLITDKDHMAYSDYPTYLTDDSPFNDVRYTLNKHILFGDGLNVVKYTLLGLESTSFDEYSNWMHKYAFGKEAILRTYSRPEKAQTQVVFSDAEKEMVTGNVMQNVVALAQQYPDVDFYYFFTPYGIYYWDLYDRLGQVEYQVQAHKLATELMLQQENIHIFSFYTEYDVLLNPDNYSDPGHYHEDVNSQILVWIKDGHGLLTKDNYQQHWDEVLEYYSNFDYDAIF